MYSVDTNIYLDWWVRRYPEDIFPNVCAALGVSCIDLLELMRREHWVFK